MAEERRNRSPSNGTAPAHPERPVHFDGGSIAFTTSVGVSTLVGPELHRLIEAADSALYRAKNAGRNRVEVA